MTIITRLRLDAALYHPTPPRRRLGPGRPRLKGERQPTLQTRLSDPQTDWQRLSVRWYGGAEREVELATGSAVWRHSRLPPAPIRWVLVRDPEGRFEPRALLSTDLEADARRIVQWFVLGWQLEVTFHEVRTHLGVETQRQWSGPTIARVTSALFGLFSLVTLCARELIQHDKIPTRQSAWYAKPLPTFADTLALTRRQLWPVSVFHLSPTHPDIVKIPRPLLDRLTETLAFVA